MKGRFIGLTSGTVVGFLMVLIISTFTYVPKYVGKISMNETQYSNFKTAIAQKNVTVDYINVLNSNEPIVVLFEVHTKDVFPYGNKVMNPEILLLIVISIFGGAMGFSLGIVNDNYNAK
jgi:hypothetical protein